MTVLDAIRGRYSVRNYTGEPVGDTDLATVLEAARLAQSAKNIQNWKFVVVRDRALRERLVPACRNQGFVAQAPVVIACCGTETDYVMTCGQPAYALDVAIAMENMSLVAHEIGLGTCWLGAFYEDQVKEVLKIPAAVRIVGMLTLGHPAGTPPVKKRLSAEMIVRYDTWT